MEHVGALGTQSMSVIRRRAGGENSIERGKKRDGSMKIFITSPGKSISSCPLAQCPPSSLIYPWNR